MSFVPGHVKISQFATGHPRKAEKNVLKERLGLILKKKKKKMCRIRNGRKWVVNYLGKTETKHKPPYHDHKVEEGGTEREEGRGEKFTGRSSNGGPSCGT